MLSRCWHWLRNPSSTMSRGMLLVVGSIVGVVLWGGFNTAMEHTNTTAFCVSCHEMDQTVHQEYKKSVHYSNRTGVTAGCPDCHVPRQWGAKILRKIRASGELYHVVIGTIDTPEKFEARRLYLAEKVWKEMTENNSRECRNCHSYESMDFHKQTARAREKMEEAKNKNTPCIECHKGIAHNKPVVARDD